MSPSRPSPKSSSRWLPSSTPHTPGGEMKMFESRHTLVTLSPLLLQQPLDVHFAVKLLREGACEVFHVTLRGGARPRNRHGSVFQPHRDLSPRLYPSQLSQLLRYDNLAFLAHLHPALHICSYAYNSHLCFGARRPGPKPIITAEFSDGSSHEKRHN